MLNLLITPDFPPEFFANWHMFNTQLQRALDTTIHLQTPAGYREQQELLDSETVALVYANPFDAGSLMRDKGYIPLAKPDLPSDQVLVVANAQSAFAALGDLPADSRVLITANRDMESIGLGVLQGTAITVDTVQWLPTRTFPELARRLMANEAEIGLFLASSFRSLNAGTQGSLKILFETEFEQAVAMQQGLRRLLLLNVPSPIKYLHEKLPNKAKLGLYFTPFGRVLDLIDDCIACAVDKLIADFGGFVWNQEDFDKLRDFVRENVNEVTVDIAQKVEQILTLTHQLNQRLKGKMDFTMAFALSDIKSQIAGLIYQGFVQKSGYARLPDLLRYLQAIDKRMDKLAQDVNRDRAAMLRVEQVQQAYQQLLAKLPKSKPISDEVAEIRYMIEELRVSLFAQQLGTKYQVSDKRILNIINGL